MPGDGTIVIEIADGVGAQANGSRQSREEWWDSPIVGSDLIGEAGIG
jgi:hypothetical protein